jgi:methylmalonyl-CoA mutase
LKHRRQLLEQSLHTNALDEAIALPTDFSLELREIHRSIYRKKQSLKQSILGLEVTTWRLTHEIADHAWKLIEEVEELGGMTIEDSKT